jgi:hypothetical protein
MSLGTKPQIVLVPQWVIKQLTRHGLALNTVLDLKVLKQYCSQEDLSIIWNMNQNPGHLFGINHIRMELFYYWSAFSSGDYESLSKVVPLYEGRLEERLFSSEPDTVVTGEQDCLIDKAFSIQNVCAGLDEKEVLLIVIHAGCFGGTNLQKAQQQLVRAYLKQSYALCSYDQVASDPIYLKYLYDLKADMMSV